jgi:hypothetical protein
MRPQFHIPHSPEKSRRRQTSLATSLLGPWRSAEANIISSHSNPVAVLRVGCWPASANNASDARLTPGHAPLPSSTASDSMPNPSLMNKSSRTVVAIARGDDNAPRRHDRRRSHPFLYHLLRWPVFREDRTPILTIARRQHSTKQ